MADYIPSPDLDFGTWLNTFANQASSLAIKYSIPAGMITQVKSDALMWGFIMSNSDTVTKFGTSFTSFKRNQRDGALGGAVVPFPIAPIFAGIPTTVANGIERRARNLAGLFKANKSIYNDTDGKAMGIMGEDPPQTTTDMDAMQPVIQVLMSGGKVVVKWKKGKADSINIYVDRGDGQYIYLANDAQPDYTDNAALPAGATAWTYRAIYVVKDTEVGQFSEAVGINVKKFV